MSRINKVNPGNYTQQGRLTPDDAARERGKQAETHGRVKDSDHLVEKKGPIPGEPESNRPRSAPGE
jgi:hypothetical protein